METQKEANARWSQHLQQKFDQWTPGKSPEEIAAAKPGLTALQNVLSSSMERNGGREYWGGNVVIFLTGGD